MGQVRPEEGHFDLPAKSSSKGERRPLIVEIRYVPIPYAEERLSRAIDILLNAAEKVTSTSKASKDTKKKEKHGPSGGDEGGSHG